MPAQKTILLNANQLFVWHKMAQYVNKFLVWHKKFGPAQNILGPVKGQGISPLECWKKSQKLVPRKNLSLTVLALILRFLPNLLALCHRVVAGILNISEALVKDKRPSFKQSKAKSMSWVV